MLTTQFKPNWSTLTLGQFQQIHVLMGEIKKAENTPGVTALQSLNNAITLVSIVYGIPITEVEALPFNQFTSLAKECNFLQNGAISAKPVRWFKIARRKYRINYHPLNINQAGFSALLGYLDNPIGNLHHIMAIIVSDARLFNKKTAAHILAQKLLDAPFTPLYNALAYYLNLFVKMLDTLSPGIAETLKSDVSGRTLAALNAAKAELTNYTR